MISELLKLFFFLNAKAKNLDLEDYQYLAPQLQPLLLLLVGHHPEKHQSAWNKIAKVKDHITNCFIKLPREQVKLAWARFRP